MSVVWKILGSHEYMKKELPLEKAIVVRITADLA